MAISRVYAALIKKGLKTINDVPEIIRAEVQAVLKDYNYV